MSIRTRQWKASTFATANDHALFAAVAALNEEAVVETYNRHANALGSLALLIAEDVEFAMDAVVRAFIPLWRAPTSINLEEHTLRAALAGNVYTYCTCVRNTRSGSPQRAKTCWNWQGTTLASLFIPSRTQRDLLGLILLGEHNHRQAARRVGLDEDIAAKMITTAVEHRQLQRLLDLVDFTQIVAV